MDEEEVDIFDKLLEAKECFQNKDYDGASKLYCSILEANPQFAQAWGELAVVAYQLKDMAQVIHCLKQAYACQPNNSHKNYYLIQLGDAYRNNYQLHEAILTYRQASEGALPGELEHIYNHLGVVLVKIGNFEEAQQTYLKAIDINPYNEVTFNNYGILLEKMLKLEEAAQLFLYAVKLNPFYSLAHNNLARIRSLQGFFEVSREEYKRASESDPKNITALWGYLLFLPMLYESKEEITQVNKRWRENIDVLIKTIPLNTQEEIQEAVNALLFHVGFYIPYQGGNCLTEQLLYGNLVSKISQANPPQFVPSISPRIVSSKEKIRVGFVSAFFYFHSVFKTHGHWITKLDKKQFEIHCFYLNDKIDPATESIRAHADFFFQNSLDYSQMIMAIEQQKLDILIYLDIGMVPQEQLMGSLRLAPIQCMTYGHPVTSGLPTIDYYLSSDLMEPNNGDEHYVEQLIRLPNLAVSYPFPDLAKMKIPPSCPKKDPNHIVYVNPQSFFKLLPQYDDIYPKIALQLPHSQFHFIGKYVVQPFYDRLKRAFSHFGLSIDDYCYFHPPLSYGEFLGLMDYADIFLDSMEWSGCNSTMEALASNTPVVTLPGATFRSRHTYGILTMMDMPELIARDLEEYLSIAVKLGKETSFREAIAAKINTNKHLVFDDPQAIEGLQCFLNDCFKRKK